MDAPSEPFVSGVSVYALTVNILRRFQRKIFWDFVCCRHDPWQRSVCPALASWQCWPRLRWWLRRWMSCEPELSLARHQLCLCWSRSIQRWQVSHSTIKRIYFVFYLQVSVQRWYEEKSMVCITNTRSYMYFRILEELKRILLNQRKKHNIPKYMENGFLKF